MQPPNPKTNNRRGLVVSFLLVVFTVFVAGWQCWPGHMLQQPLSSLKATYIREGLMARTADIIKRDKLNTPGDGWSRLLDLEMPENARVFITDMTGPTNYSKMGYYMYATYYLFPREVGVNLDGPTYLIWDHLTGRTSDSDQEILAHGYDVRLDNGPNGVLIPKALHSLDIKEPRTPGWFNSFSDWIIAFLLPLVTTVAGMWPLRFLAPELARQMTFFDRLACGLGLGMMMVAAVTLGVKLCGLSGYGLILALTYLGAFVEIWCHRGQYQIQFKEGYSAILNRPSEWGLLALGLLVFLVLFRFAGLAGLTDPDSLRWMLKSKIMHLYTGSEMVRWFSNPGMAFAHLDYPTLVPSLHAATYDSIGNVDEFVTKFWPVWMLLFLLTGLATLMSESKSRFNISWLVPLGVLLLPVIQQYVQWEGSTMFMVFYTTLGCMQCCLALAGNDRARLVLGLTLLFGGAMTTLQGVIVLGVAAGTIVLLPSLRRTLKAIPHLWRMAGFWLAAALPFIWLRLHIPVVNYESNWTHYAAQHPGTMLTTWPRMTFIELCRMFFNTDFTFWTGENEQFHWSGKWEGVSSLYNHSTLGMAWVCLAMTVIVWLTMPARRAVVIWILAIFSGTLIALCGVFSSFAYLIGLDRAVQYTGETVAGRYLLPVLLAWFVTMILLLFGKTDVNSTEIAELPVTPDAPAATNPENSI